MSDKYREIGEILAAARREQNKTLKDASESTKIMEQYLVALESGTPEKLPSQAYFHLFARSYAQYLGLDAAIFNEIEDHEPSFGDNDSEGDGSVVSNKDSAEAVSHAQAKKFGRSLVYLVVIIVVIFLAFIVYNQFFVSPESGVIDEETAGETANEATNAEDGQELAELIIPETMYDPPGKLRLYMKVKQDVWGLVVRDGDTVLNRRLVAGDERYWEADYRYNLTLGISTAVDLYVNDQKLAPLTDRARTIADLEINQVNYKEYLPVEVDNVAPPSIPAPTPTDDAVVDRTEPPGEDSADGD